MKRYIFAISVVLATAATTHAQVEEQVTPAELKQKTVVTEPQTLYKGFLRSGLAFNYSVLDKIFNTNKKKESLPSNIWATSSFVQLFALYGINNRLQAEIRLPYKSDHLYQSMVFEVPDIDSVEVVKYSTKSSGLGDLSLTLGYQLATESISKPSLAIFVTANLPTGQKNPNNVKNEREYKQALGAGEPSLNTSLRLRKVNYPFVYSISMDYTYFFGGTKLLDPLDTEEKSFRSGSNFDLGGYFYFHLNDWIAFRNIADFFYSKADTFDGETQPDDSWSFMYYPGLSFQIKQFRIDQAVSIPLAGKLSAADPGYILGLTCTF